MDVVVGVRGRVDIINDIPNLLEGFLIEDMVDKTNGIKKEADTYVGHVSGRTEKEGIDISYAINPHVGNRVIRI